jgi:hypothetical protein
MWEWSGNLGIGPGFLRTMASGSGRPVRGPHPRDISSQTQTPAAQEPRAQRAHDRAEDHRAHARCRRRRHRRREPARGRHVKRARIGFAVAALLSMGHAAFISQGVSGVSVAWRRLLQARSSPVFFRRNQPFAKVAPPRAVVACTGDQVRFWGEAEVDRQEKLANSVANDPNETRLPQNRCCARLPLNRFRRA